MLLQKERSSQKLNKSIDYSGLSVGMHGEVSPPRCVAVLAACSMTLELRATPKPGLVDLKDSGAHDDMNFQTFYDSIAAVSQYYHLIEAASFKEPNGALLEKLRPIGIQAEKAMLKATKGINTHKGQIFVLGLLVAAVASWGRVNTPDQLRDKLMKISGDLVEKELEPLSDAGSGLSNGERLYIEEGCRGIRGEAADGFPAVFETGLPVFYEMIVEGYSANSASVQTLIHLMSTVDDTTVLNRRGRAGLNNMREESRQALERGGIKTPEGREYLSRMNEYFIRERISPGGCADLLAGTIFVYQYFSGFGCE